MPGHSARIASGHERRVRDDRLGRAYHPGGHRVEPRVEVPDGDVSAVLERRGKRPSPRAVRPLQLARVVLRARAREVGRREEVVEDELVENDHGGSPALGIEESLDGRSVQRVVADLHEEHVVTCPKRSFRAVGFIGDEGKRRFLRK